MTEDNKNTVRKGYGANLKDELIRAEADKQAILSEFSEALASGSFSKADLQDKFKNLMADAYQQIQDLIANGDSESVRLSAAKFAINFYTGLADSPDDINKSFRDLLKEMKD